MQRLLPLALLLIVAPSVQAQLSEPTALREYGACVVSTEVGPLKRAAVHVFACGEFTAASLPVISILRDQAGTLAVGFGSGLVADSDAPQAVTIRVDEGPLIERAAPWDQSVNAAKIEDPRLARSLLPVLARGLRVAISIGSKRGVIHLKGSARAASDFRHRAGLGE